MSLFFEIADLSFELIGCSMDMVTGDIRHFFREIPADGFRRIRCRVIWTSDYQPVKGQVLVQDPYRIVLEEEGREYRIFFETPFSNIYGTCQELGPDEIRIETSRPYIDMRFLELLSIEKYLLQEDAFILHACYVAYRDTGMAFTAPSGTGKSTQGSLWEKYGDGEVINGDRAILQRKDDQWYVHSLPFCGSSLINKAASMPLKSVVIVNRDLADHVEVSDPERDFLRLVNEVTCNWYDQASYQRIAGLVEQLLRQGLVVNLYCTPTRTACDRLKEYLYHV